MEEQKPRSRFPWVLVIMLLFLFATLVTMASDVIMMSLIRGRK